jgi:hypothetical protein
MKNEIIDYNYLKDIHVQYIYIHIHINAFIYKCVYKFIYNYLKQFFFY